MNTTNATTAIQREIQTQRTVQEDCEAAINAYIREGVLAMTPARAEAIREKTNRYLEAQKKIEGLEFSLRALVGA